MSLWPSAEIFSIISSVTSIILSLVALWLALHFYEKTKETEQQVGTSLSKIEAQTESLQKINAKWMDRLTRFATEDRPAAIEGRFSEIVTVLMQLPQAIATRVTQPDKSESQEELIEELFTCYIVIYYYSALANFWAQLSIPKVGDLDAKNEFQSLAMRIVDGSHADFQHFNQILGRADQDRLNSNTLATILEETKVLWRHEVRTTSEVFVLREQAND